MSRFLASSKRHKYNSQSERLSSHTGGKIRQTQQFVLQANRRRRPFGLVRVKDRTLRGNTPHLHAVEAYESFDPEAMGFAS
jgi:hypothetical protein